jgi:uncharacterized protein involved in response to NO
MTLAVMARASLGHTGQALTAGPGCVTALALVTVAAVLRVMAPFVTGHYEMLLTLSGLAWIGAFALFTLLFAPLLAKPRRRRASATG